MKRIKIGYVLAGLGFGGVEKYGVDLVNHLCRGTFEPIIFCVQSAGPLRSAIQSDVPVYELCKRPGNDLTLPLRLARLLRDEGVNIIHSNNWSTFLEAAGANLLSPGTVFLHTQHGLEMNGSESFGTWTRYKRNRMRQILAHLTDQIVVVSKATRHFVCSEWKTQSKKVTLIYNGVDLDSFSGRTSERHEMRKELCISESDIVIGSVGRLAPVKNYSCLIKAFHRVSRNYCNLRLILIGDGPEKETLQSLARDLGIGHKVLLLGNRSDVTSLLTTMDIFVSSSISEGVSLALLEAMASSLAVVATNVGGNPEVVQNDKSGMLIDSDDVVSMSRALQTLIDHPTTRQKLAKHARTTVETTFSLKRMIEHYEILYRSLSFKN